MNLSNNDICIAINENPDKGFRLLIQRYGEQLYWHIRRLVASHDDAQDAEQETFIKAYRGFSQLETPKALTSWLYRIATREALRMIEKNKKPAALLDNIDDKNGSLNIKADPYVDYSDAVAVKLQKAILSLPPKQQLAFNMRYYDDMDYQQIADIMDTTPSTAKVNYHLAKEKIIKFMNTND